MRIEYVNMENIFIYRKNIFIGINFIFDIILVFLIKWFLFLYGYSNVFYVKYVSVCINNFGGW